MKQSIQNLALMPLFFVAINSVSAQGTDGMANMPGMTNMPSTNATSKATQPTTTSASMAQMSSSVDLNDPMSQEASGTSWIPSSTPIYGKMYSLNGNMLMLHGAAMPRYIDVGSKRGDRRFDAPNWFMGMYNHPLDAKSQLGLRGMFSLDPITEGGYGYPLLFQTGETWHGDPLHDRQHPHNFQDEIAATYSHLLSGGKSIAFYLGDPGEPALGPPTYMHRLLASDYADAPIGHHWQDATHITFGVATVGLNMSSKVKIEASDFTGREPDENRWSFNRPRFDSYSTRLSYNPDQNDAFQISYGLVRDPEGDGANIHRTTASWIYNKPLGEDSNFTTALVWGQNDLTTEGISNSYLAEADYQWGKDTLFSRLENIDKSGSELVLPSGTPQSELFNLNAFTVGYVRDLSHGTGIDTGLGFAVTADAHPTDLDSVYGASPTPTFEIFFRFRPSRMKTMGTMAGMDMSVDQPMANKPLEPLIATTPVISLSAPQSATGTSAPTTPRLLSNASSGPIVITNLTARIQPDSPQAGHDSVLYVTVTGYDNKPFVGAIVSGVVQMVSMDMGTSQVVLKDQGDGNYKGNVAFAMPGSWKISLSALEPNGDNKLTKVIVFDVVR